MSGIAGIIEYGEQLSNRHNVLECMLECLNHRGPDQSGICEKAHAGLVSARLAVVDIKSGHQPMTALDGDREYTIVYNGELYNTDEIQNRLISEGMVFETRSDTEVVLKAFIKWGERCLDAFNGVYAFTIWEAKEEKLFLARDRMGVKPLFFARLESGLVFGSELKAVLKHPKIPPQIDLNGISELLLLGPGRTPGCGVFKGINELLPGQCAEYSRDGFKTRIYWTLKDAENNDTFDQTLEKVRWLIIDAIERQTVSDVQIATFLSGGLNSSIISAIVAGQVQKQGKKLHTFSVDYADNDPHVKANHFQQNSDNLYIRNIAEHIGCVHTTITLNAEEVADALFDAVVARDLPGMVDVDSTLLLLCRRVRQDATVVLSGECGDEIFGGYPWYRDIKIRNKNGFPWSQSTSYRTSFLNDNLADSLPAHEFIQERYRDSISAIDIIGNPPPIERRMKEMMGLNLRWFIQTLLERKDRTSMYSGLEVRIPFCDHRIIEAFYRMPWKYKDYEGREKGLLRKAFEDLLPDEVLWRRKSPYPKILNPEYNKIISDRLNDVIASPHAPLLKLIDQSALETLLKDNRNEQWYGQLMNTPQTIAYFLQMHYWLAQYHVEIVI
ncbi:MAG TPA: asparagine synthase (glutamine-hydrolyzing) [Ruminococcaceae bacterium]|nr:asparagine synthase (glutamine-hydrolyzing) [Oscillospiraceae bacterium]